MEVNEQQHIVSFWMDNMLLVCIPCEVHCSNFHYPRRNSVLEDIQNPIMLWY